MSPDVLPTALLCLAVAFSPLTVILNDVPRHYDVDAVLFIGDVLLVLFAAALVMRRTSLAASGPPMILLALAVWLAVALAFHPSVRGLLFVGRVAASAGAALWLAGHPQSARPVVWTMVATAAIQAGVGIAQVALDGPVGLASLGETNDPLWPFGDTSAPQGTMVHPYVLAGWALVAGTAAAVVRLHPAAVAVAAIPVGLTFSRAGALGLLLAAGALMARRQRATVIAAVALLLGAGLPAVLQADGWLSRVEQTTSARSERSLTSDRGELVGQSLEVIEDHPVTGVGPGRYASAPGVERTVHNVALLVAAEAGIPGGLLVIALLVALGLYGSWPLLLALLPFFLLDHFPYDFPQGVLATGVWAGVAAGVRRPPSGAPEAHA